MTTMCEKLIKICAKVVRHGRYVTFQLAEIAIPRRLFAEILRLIAEQGICYPCFPAREGLVPSLTCWAELAALLTLEGRIPTGWNFR